MQNDSGHEARTRSAAEKKKGPEPKPGPSRKPKTSYCCGGVFGVTEIGFGASGAFGAVNPGMIGLCPVTPVAALCMLIP